MYLRARRFLRLRGSGTKVASARIIDAHSPSAAVAADGEQVIDRPHDVFEGYRTLLIEAAGGDIRRLGEILCEPLGEEDRRGEINGKHLLRFVDGLAYDPDVGRKVFSGE